MFTSYVSLDTVLGAWLGGTWDEMGKKDQEPQEANSSGDL